MTESLLQDSSGFVNYRQYLIGVLTLIKAANTEEVIVQTIQVIIIIVLCLIDK